MKKILISLLICVNLIVYSKSFANQLASCNGKIILGPIEKVSLPENNLVLPAKLDTGAAMSSLSATNIKILRTAGNHLWVQFTLNIPEGNQKIIFTKSLLKYVRILKRNEEMADGNLNKEYSLRPVTALTIQLRNNKYIILVNLTDRTQFKYALILGRDALQKFNAVIDLNQK